MAIEEHGLECLIGDPGTELRKEWTDYLDNARKNGEDVSEDNMRDAVRGWLYDAAERGMLDEAGAFAAVSVDGSLLGDVPPGYRTKDVCLEAVFGDWYALGDVPNSLLTPEVCGEAVASAVRSELDIDNPAVWNLVPEGMEDDVRRIALERLADEGIELEEDKGPRP